MTETAQKPNPRKARIGFRTTEQQQFLIRRAADVSQKSVTEFVLDSACAAAENVLIDQRLFFPNEAEWNRFQEILNRPAEVKPDLQRLMDEVPPWE